MTVLAADRVGPYVRALSAAINALAPDERWVPMREAQNHLHALDPALSGELLAPAEVSPTTGMPAYSWLNRAAAEAEVAGNTSPQADPTDAKLAQVRDLDPSLAERLRARRGLHQHLRESRTLPTTRIAGAARRLTPTLDLTIRYDRITPNGLWERIRVDLQTDSGAVPAGIQLMDEGRVRVFPAMKHLLTRHFATPLIPLHTQVAEVTGARVTGLSRAWLGPFWWPGMTLPDGVPQPLGSGLVLHASHEVVGIEVRSSGHLDPWRPPPESERPPPDQRVFRERRFAASAPLVPALHEWFEQSGMRGTVYPIGHARRRQL